MRVFTYAQVERVLADVHEVPPRLLGSFRGRIKHFQRLGIVPASPGRGRKIAYSVNDVLLWGFGLELSEFGIDPTVIREILKHAWPRVLDAVTRVGPMDRFWFFSPSMVNAAPKRDTPDDGSEDGPFVIWFRIIDKLDDIDPQDVAAAERLKARYGMINLTRLRREIVEALERSAPAETA